MVACWMVQRAGAPDAHAEMRGVVMLAAANDTVERLNDAAQAVRAAAGELGPEHLFEVKAGRSLRLRQGDHVLVRLNDRAQRMHEGPDVLNGYRGIVEHIDADGSVGVAWKQQGEDGLDTRRARLSPEFVAGGGLSLGYAMTGHKAEGLTVAADWALPGGTRQGGTVLVHAAGMDEPGLHVATSRHRDKVLLFAGRDQLETPADTHERGIPATDVQRARRVIAALAEQARTRPGNANDRPVHDDLGGAPTPPGAQPSRRAATTWAEIKAQLPAKAGTAPAGPGDASAAEGAAGRISELEERELLKRWVALTGRDLSSATPGGTDAAGEGSAQDAQRRAAALREDEVRRRQHNRGPRL